MVVWRTITDGLGEFSWWWISSTRVAWWLHVGSRRAERGREREAQTMGLTLSRSVGIGALLRAEAQVV